MSLISVGVAALGHVILDVAVARAAAARRPPTFCAAFGTLPTNRDERSAMLRGHGRPAARTRVASRPRPSPGLGCAMRGSSYSPPSDRTGARHHGPFSPSETLSASPRRRAVCKGLSENNGDRGIIRVFERATRARHRRFEALVFFIFGGIQGGFRRQHG